MSKLWSCSHKQDILINLESKCIHLVMIKRAHRHGMCSILPCKRANGHFGSLQAYLRLAKVEVAAESCNSPGSSPSGGPLPIQTPHPSPALEHDAPHACAGSKYSHREECNRRPAPSVGER